MRRCRRSHRDRRRGGDRTAAESAAACAASRSDGRVIGIVDGIDIGIFARVAAAAVTQPAGHVARGLCAAGLVARAARAISAAAGRTRVSAADVLEGGAAAGCGAGAGRKAIRAGTSVSMRCGWNATWVLAFPWD